MGYRTGFHVFMQCAPTEMQPVGCEKDLAPRPAFVTAKTHDLIAIHRTAVLLVATFLIIEVVGRCEMAKEHCSGD
jgi:hypothetical protein